MEAKENCGVAALYLKNGFAKKNPEFLSEGLYMMLLEMQHRGQQSAGIFTFNPNPGEGKRHFHLHKELGLVKEVFNDSHSEKRSSLIKKHKGKMGIGHIRYVTSGDTKSDEDALEEAQPFYRRHFRPFKRFGIAYNGNLANYHEIERKLEKEIGYDLETNVDTELLMALFALNLQLVNGESNSKPDWIKVISNVSKEIDGAYSCIILSGNGDIIAFKDPNGIRPLVYGENEKIIGVASESSALDRVGIKNCIDIEPGQLIIISNDKITKESYAVKKEPEACCFEYIYFSFINSAINGIDVFSARERLGIELARNDPFKGKFKSDGYFVTFVPNTAKTAAYAYAKELELPLIETLIRNESVGRAFIQKKEGRDRTLETKFTPVSKNIEGKKLIVIEDSIIRGDTSNKIIDIYRNNGAIEVHFRSTFPPVKYPCFYGIDFPSYEELIANQLSNINFDEFVAKKINADSVACQTLNGMIKAIGTPRLCVACLTGKYPTPFAQKRADELAQSFRSKL